MILGIPLAGRQDQSPIPEWLPLNEAMEAGGIKVSKRVFKTDWRSQLAEDDGQWLVWFDVNDDGDIEIGLGLIAHAKDEGEKRKQGFVSVRPFTRPRTEIPISTIVGTLDIPDRDRHIWAQIDGQPPSVAGSQLRHSRWFIVRPHPETEEPCCVFSPERWRSRPKGLAA